MPWYLASSLALAGGSIVSGTLEDTYSDNGVELVLAELDATPGFAYEFTFGDNEGVPTDTLYVSLRGYYDGTLGHVVRLEQWNYTSSQWITIGGATFPDETSEQHYQITLLEPFSSYHEALAATRDIVLIPMDKALADKLVKEYPYYVQITIPPGTYSKVDHDVLCLGDSNALIANPNMKEDVAYKVVKAIFSNV